MCCRHREVTAYGVGLLECAHCLRESLTRGRANKLHGFLLELGSMLMLSQLRTDVPVNLRL